MRAPADTAEVAFPHEWDAQFVRLHLDEAICELCKPANRHGSAGLMKHAQTIGAGTQADLPPEGFFSTMKTGGIALALRNPMKSHRLDNPISTKEGERAHLPTF